MVAKKKISIFKDLSWLDDSFYETDGFKSPDGWDVTIGAYSTDGDIATLNGEIQKDLDSVESDDFENLVLRIPSGTGKSLVKVLSGGAWTTVKELGVATGDLSYRIPAGLTMTKIAVSGTGGPVYIDYVGMTDTEPIHLEKEITKIRVDQKTGFLPPQVNFTALNKNKALNTIMKGDTMMVWMGDNEYVKVFGGRIFEPRRKWPGKTLSASGYGNERYVMSNPFAEEVEAQFVATKLTTIVSTVTFDSVDNGDITLHQFTPVINTGTGSEAALTIDFSKTTELTAMRDILEALAVTGLQAEGRIDPTGDMVLFGSGTVDSGISIDEDEIIETDIILASRLINKVVLHTPEMTKFPQDGDAWTDLSTPVAKWTARVNHDLLITVSGELIPDLGRVQTGAASKYLKVDYLDDDGYIQLDLDFTRSYDLTDYISMKFDYYVPSGTTESEFQVRLCEILDDDGDSSSYWYQDVTIVEDEWQSIQFDTGKDASGWSASGGVSDWEGIRYVALRFVTVSAERDVDLWLDSLHFTKGEPYNTQLDQTSIDAYGLSVQSFTRSDIRSKDVADNIMSQIIALNKDPTTNLAPKIKGNANIVPGENIHVTLGDEDIDQYYRVTKVTHDYRNGLFTTKLNLTVTGTSYWTDVDFGMFSDWKRFSKWSTLGVDILPLWG